MNLDNLEEIKRIGKKRAKKLLTQGWKILKEEETMCIIGRFKETECGENCKKPVTTADVLKDELKRLCRVNDSLEDAIKQNSKEGCVGFGTEKIIGNINAMYKIIEKLGSMSN